MKYAFMNSPINECAQELHDSKQRATENALAVERCQVELEDLRKQNQDLREEKEALKAMVCLQHIGQCIVLL